MPSARTALSLFKTAPISPYDEMLAYESIWAASGMTETTVTELFKSCRLPTEVFAAKTFDAPLAQEISQFLEPKLGQFSICLNGDFQYPQRLRDARHPVDLFYFKGDLGLIERPAISVVGARNCTPEGGARAKKLARGLAENGFTIVSGLATGIDTYALSAAMEVKDGRVIAVIGTPIDEYYPKENRDLQDRIADKHLLISQVPFYRYSHEHFNSRKFYFPRRNSTMSALSLATVIVEASEKSGTLTQARAAIHQGRPLFILDSCFKNKSISWPSFYEKKGAVRVSELKDIVDRLGVKIERPTALEKD